MLTSSCVLVKAECDEEIDFNSSRQMQGAPNRAHGGICLHSSTIQEKLLGECADRTCSPNESSCSGIGFRDVLQSTRSCSVEGTMFGRCGDRCSWSPDNCLADEEWTFPSPGCSCDMVQVGSCEKDGKHFCAVSPDSCDVKATWLSPTAVSTTGTNCFLCREKISVAHNTAVDSSGISASEGSTSVGSTSGVSTSGGGSNKNVGVIVGSVVGGVGGLAMVVAAFVFVRRRQDRNGREVVTAPLPTIGVDKDDVSVL